MIKRTLFSLSLMLLTFCCQSSKPHEKADLLLSMKKTGCFGECPIYILKVYENGVAELEGERFVDKIGFYRAMITEEQLRELKQSFEQANFFAFEGLYTSTMTDLPTTILYFSHNGHSKKVTDYDRAPESLRKLETKVADLLTDLKWKKVNK